MFISDPNQKKSLQPTDSYYPLLLDVFPLSQINISDFPHPQYPPSPKPQIHLRFPVWGLTRCVSQTFILSILEAGY